ncbi:heat shock protein [Blumeria hordei DH14]|uniref:Heat shock protein n=1 Tax=Blumeria graminis f. sp. hordei (strain DH14) TaxID=546991 RepID=N1JGM9_BLUG1|nr:heat shock protein [Blumeria hordei DH14]
MSLFPRTHFHHDQLFIPTVFQVLDEINQYSCGMDRNTHQIRRLPSIDQKDVDIELTDASTLTIKGCVEHSYSKGSPQAGFVEGETGKDSNLSVKKRESSNTSWEKFWVMERSFEESSRSFAFPVLVNQERVMASMKDGILSVLMPKSKKQKYRKISIQYILDGCRGKFIFMANK